MSVRVIPKDNSFHTPEYCPRRRTISVHSRTHMVDTKDLITRLGSKREIGYCHFCHKLVFRTWEGWDGGYNYARDKWHRWARIEHTIHEDPDATDIGRSAAPTRKRAPRLKQTNV